MSLFGMALLHPCLDPTGLRIYFKGVCLSVLIKATQGAAECVMLQVCVLEGLSRSRGRALCVLVFVAHHITLTV